MGIVRFEDTQKAELEEFRRMLLSCAAVHRRKDDDGIRGGRENALPGGNGDVLDRLVCVTSGVSYLGIAIVNQLLVNGYSVRIIVDNQEDVEKLREMEISGEMRLSNSIVEIVMAKLTQVDSLTQAFDGCRCVFHTAAFVDPAGLSGYSQKTVRRPVARRPVAVAVEVHRRRPSPLNSVVAPTPPQQSHEKQKAMANIEVNASKNVVKACGVSPSVRHCVLTSSLLTCIWQDNSLDQVSRLIDHKSWSDESVCINKKLWYALGKLRAEKAAWEIAKESGLKLSTICPGLITGSEFFLKSPTSTIAYLKGVQEMYGNGILATVDINRLAKAHVIVFEEMKKASSGRYICFDRVIERQDEIEKLARDTCISVSSIIAGGGGSSSSGNNRTRFELSNTKLARLMLRNRRCYNE